MKIHVDEAKKLIKIYFAAFPSVKAYFDRITEEAIAVGYCVTELGRRRELPGLFSAYSADYSSAIRKLKNTPIQGTAAEIAKMAMIGLYEDEYLVECGLRLLINVHDEVVMLVPTHFEHNDDFNDRVRHHMEHPRLLENFTVPLRTTGRYGDTWAETK